MRVSREEWRWVYGFAAAALLVTGLPYLLGFSAQGTEWVFTGFVFGVEDGNSYLAKMLSGQAGAWLFRTPYTTGPQRGVLAFLPYLLLGKLAAAPGLHTQLAALYHLFRLAAGFLEVAATYRFLSLFLGEVRTRRWALGLAILGGGLGWVLILLGQDRWLGSLPLDFYSPETFGFLGFYGLPHLALARALLLWGLAAYLETPRPEPPVEAQEPAAERRGNKNTRPAQAVRERSTDFESELNELGSGGWGRGLERIKKTILSKVTRNSLSRQAVQTAAVPTAPAVPTAAVPSVADPAEWRAGARAGLLWLAMGLAQPLTVAVAWAVLGAHLGFWGLALALKTRQGPGGEAWRGWRAAFRRAAIAVLVSSPIVLYTAVAFRSDTFLMAWTAQNIIRSPHPLHYLVAYGLLLVPAYLGGRRLLGGLPAGQGWLPVGWVLALPLLAYLPLNLQRRLPEGGWVALVILAMAGLEAIERNRGPAEQRKIPRSFLPTLLLYPSSLLLVLLGVTGAMRTATPLFHPAAEVAAFEALAQQAPVGAGVVAAYDTGNALPAWAPVRVVIGHGPESAGLEALRPQVEAFYRQSTSDEERLAMLETWNAQYIFWGPNERELGDWQPAGDHFSTVYEQDGYAIFTAGDLD